MKVLSGTYKGRHFYMPADIRPSQDMLRKAIFDILGQDLSGVLFLDLFGGSGSVGIEALSNGAKHVTFVERNPKNAKIIEENLRLIDPTIQRDRYSMICGDVYAQIKLLARQKRAFDVIFFDPPYGEDLAKKALKTLMSHDILTAHSFVVGQYGKHEKMPDVSDQMTLIKHKKYGTSFLTVYERNLDV